MGSLFVKCIKLEKLPDISQWKTGNVTDMTYMFYKCKSLKSLPDISVWDTSKVRDMFYMFGNCRALESLPDISKWNLTTKMFCVFQGCKETLNIPKNFKTQKV